MILTLFALDRYLNYSLMTTVKGAKSGSVSEHYIIGKQLGTGAFSVVNLVTHRESGRKAAVKVIDTVKHRHQVPSSPPLLSPSLSLSIPVSFFPLPPSPSLSLSLCLCYY